MLQSSRYGSVESEGGGTHCQFARKSGGLRPSNDSSMRKQAAQLLLSESDDLPATLEIASLRS